MKRNHLNDDDDDDDGSSDDGDVPLTKIKQRLAASTTPKSRLSKSRARSVTPDTRDDDDEAEKSTETKRKIRKVSISPGHITVFTFVLHAFRRAATLTVTLLFRRTLDIAVVNQN